MGLCNSHRTILLFFVTQNSSTEMLSRQRISRMQCNLYFTYVADSSYLTWPSRFVLYRHSVNKSSMTLLLDPFFSRRDKSSSKQTEVTSRSPCLIIREEAAAVRSLGKLNKATRPLLLPWMKPSLYLLNSDVWKCQAYSREQRKLGYRCRCRPLVQVQVDKRLVGIYDQSLFWNCTQIRGIMKEKKT
jgi:hypothetical protein